MMFEKMAKSGPGEQHVYLNSSVKTSISRQNYSSRIGGERFLAAVIMRQLPDSPEKVKELGFFRNKKKFLVGRGKGGGAWRKQKRGD